MTAFPTSPALLMVGVLALLASGLAVMTWGRRLPRQGDWLVGLGLLVLMVIIGLDWGVLSDESFTPRSWLVGWIWPSEETGSITVGVLRDALGLTMAALTVFVSASVLIGQSAQTRAQRGDRFCASLAISGAGVALSWFSSTPWLALTGLAISIFGGFLAMGSQWQDPKEAALATRFGWERSWGLILSLLGLCVLAGGRAHLSLINPLGIAAWSAQSGESISDLLGAGMLFLGALVQLQPFPLLGWIMAESETPTPTRIVLAQVFPAWAVFAVLIRLEPQLREVGVFPAFGWLGLASALLASVAGVFRTQWRIGLSAWVSAGFSLAIAALAFAGTSAALSLVIGVGLAASALAGFATSLELGGNTSKTNSQRAAWSKVGCGLAAAAGTGFIGFVIAGGGLCWLTLVGTQPALLAASTVVFFLFSFLGWKVAWNGIALKNFTQSSWAAVLAPYILILLALGLLWTGTVTGGIISGNSDRLFESLLSLLLGSNGETASQEDAFITASGLFWGSLVLSVGAAFWTAGKRPDFWPSAQRAFPRFSMFVESGYGIDILFQRVIRLIASIGMASEWLVDRKIWETWIPAGFGKGLERGASYIAGADAKLAWRLGGVLRRWVEVPSKMLQLIQNGDVQWYLFFAVGSGIAILAHYMKT